MIDILSEFAAMSSAAAEKAPEWLAGQGVPRSVLFGPHACVIGVARIETGGRYFQPEASGKPAIVIPVSPGTGACDLNPYDLVAWHPENPDRWYLRTGYGDVLGAESIDEAWIRDIPLPIYTTPLAWLQAGMEGACFLDLDSVPLHLSNITKILTDTAQMAARLHRAMTDGCLIPVIKPMENLNAA